MNNYNYLIIDCDAYFASSKEYGWQISRIIPAKVTSTSLIYQSNQLNWNFVCFKFVDDTKLQAQSVQSATNTVTKIRITDIKGLKL